MKTRKWVLVLFIVFCVVFFGWYGAWRTMRANEKIRTIILQKMQPYLASSSDIGDLKAGVRNVQLKDVIIVPKDSVYTLEVKDVRIGYNIFKLLLYRFAPSKIANELVMESPVITIRRNRKKMSGNGQNKTVLAFNSNKWAGELETIKRITITDAKIYIENEKGAKLLLGHSLDGFVKTERADSAIIRLTGAVFSKEKNNLHINGAVNLKQSEPLNFHVKVDKVEPDGDLSVVLPPYLEVNGGYFESDLYFGKHIEPKGYISIKQGELSFKGVNLIYKGVNITGDFFGDSVYVSGSVQNFNGSSLIIKGNARDIFSPKWDILLSCPDFDIPEFFRYAVPGSKYGAVGKAAYFLRLTGSLSNPTIHGSLKSDNFGIYSIGLNKYTMSIGLKDSIFTFRGSGSREKDLKFDLRGSIDFSNAKYNSFMNARLTGSLLPVINPVLAGRLEQCGGTIDVNVRGRLTGLSGSVKGEIKTVSYEGDTLLVLPLLTYSRDSLKVNISSSKDFKVAGFVFKPFREKPNWSLYSKDITDLIYPMVPAAFKRIINKLHIGAGFEGSYKKWAVTAQGQSIERPFNKTFFTLKIQPTGWGKEKKVKINSYIYDMSGKPMSAKMSVAYTDNVFNVRKLSIGKRFSGSGILNISKSDSSFFMLNLKNMDFSRLKDYFINPPSLSGFVTSSFKFSGPVIKPDVHFSLNFDSGYINKVGPLDGHLSSVWEHGKFVEAGIKVNRREKRIVFGSAKGDSSGNLSGTFRTDTLYIKEISKAIFKSDNFDGLAIMDINVAGKSLRPVVSGNVEILNGRAGLLHFKRFYAGFTDTLETFDKLEKSEFFLKKGELTRDDGFRAEFTGMIPHSMSGNLDLSVNASGNLLGVLTDISPLVKTGKGQGDASIRFVGNNRNWVIGSAKINIRKGKIKLNSIFRSLNNINIDAELKPGQRFFHINRISADVYNTPLLIENHNKNLTLPPLRIDQLGFNLGNITIRTEKPVRMSLPGLMEKGSEGKLLFKGKNSGDFVIGGPSSNPRIMGTLELYDFRFTFPILKTNGQGTGGIDKLLAKVGWDLQVVPKKDVHYTRDVSAALGNIYVDLKLQDGVGGINVKGIPESDNFEVWGNVISTEGGLEVLEHYFRPEQITFDLPRKAGEPILSGRAFTTITDSLGMPATVWIVIASQDRETGIEKRGGLWENIHFKFSTDNPNLGRSEADLMAALGYSTADIKDRVYDALGTQVENFIFRPIFRPIERGIRRHFGLDVVRFSSMFSRNLFQIRSMNVPQFDPKFLLRSTRWTLGKYLGPGVFITYTGQVQNEPYYQSYMTHGIGFRHALSLEFTLRPDLFLEFEYTYDSQLLSDRREDKKVWLRHIFPF